MMIRSGDHSGAARTGEKSMSNQSEKRAVLQAKGLCKGYGSGSGRVEALRDIDLCVYEGELLVILGSSGCGKSTLLGQNRTKKI